MAILAYIGILVVVPFLTDAKNDPFVKFHIKQGLVLLIGEVVAMFIAVFPVFGPLLSSLISLVCLVLSVLGIINAVNHETKELPVVGQWAKMFHF
ncbi:MAG: hypothetical protein M1275_01635 [Patescibacteria group bacterium]|nr:hypothetical protein [Patescibacteria group bacterium]